MSTPLSREPAATPTPSANSRPHPSRIPVESVTALLSEFELRHFFPRGLETATHGSDFPASLSLQPIAQFPKTWDDFFETVNPRVVMAGWDMPPLPEFDACSSPRKHDLKYLCFLTGTIRKKIPRSWIEHGLLVSNWGGSISHIVAESALMMILSTLRCVAANQHLLHHQGGWKLPGRPEQSLFGRTVGIHGFGRVAQALTKLLAPFEVEVVSYAPHTPAGVFAQHNVRECHSLEELMATSSIFVEAAPLNAHTQGCINRRMLDLLPEGAAFINVGRGAVVVEADLLEAAQRKNLRVALDVFSTEPLPVDSPWRARPEILLMPHQAGPTLDRCCDAGRYALQQLTAFLSGQPVDSVITAEAWDQST